jgi:hypothetical protein
LGSPLRANRFGYWLAADAQNLVLKHLPSYRDAVKYRYRPALAEPKGQQKPEIKRHFTLEFQNLVFDMMDIGAI